MRRKAELEAEIAALAAEVAEVARKRGRALPTESDWVELFVALGVPLEELDADAVCGESDTVVFCRLTRREVTPAARPLQEALLAVEAAALALERPAYLRALRELRPHLADLLVRRAETWCERWRNTAEYLDLFRGAKQRLSGATPPPSLTMTDLGPAEQIQARVAETKGWPLVLLAAVALQCAETELQEWRQWVTGEEPAPPRPGEFRPSSAYAVGGGQRAPALPEEEEAELVRRGVVSAEELAAAHARPPVPPDLAGRNLRHATRRDPSNTQD